jgi:phage gpG-like protein
MAEMRMRVRGLRELRAEVRRAIARGKDLGPPLRVLAEGLQAVIAESFATESDPSGRAWARLAASTQRDKARHRYGSATLVRTGKLRRRTTTRVVGNKVMIGIAPDVAYGANHQLGTGHLPIRRFLPFLGMPGAARLMTGPRVRRALEAFQTALRRHLGLG